MLGLATHKDKNNIGNYMVSEKANERSVWANGLWARTQGWEEFRGWLRLPGPYTRAWETFSIEAEDQRLAEESGRKIGGRYSDVEERAGLVYP